MTSRAGLARALANAFLAGDWSPRGPKNQAIETLGSCPPWASRAVRRALRQFAGPPIDRRDELARHLLDDEQFARRPDNGPEAPLVRRWLVYRPGFVSRRWDVPLLETIGDLQEWLGAESPTFDWLADPKGLERFAADERLRNYGYDWKPKRRGGWRLIERPKARLKAMQRRILHGILDRIPPHEAAHGFRRGRSVLSFASPHAGQAVVWRLDLQDFFGSVGIGRVCGVFRAAGYPEAVARTLAALCTNRAPHRLTPPEPLTATARQHLRTPHLPQGAPTSPALANLAAFGLDVRLTALAGQAGATYTRYADDFAFSFPAPVDGSRWLSLAAGIALDEGFQVNFRKVRRMGTDTRQQLAGVVVNRRPNPTRAEVDDLKATLHNCVIHGPSTQSRMNHHFRETLQGRVAWVSMLNPSRGARLQATLECIDWSR